MKPDIFMDDFSSDVEKDASYASLGRALALATRFEMGCRTLAKILLLKINPELRLESIEQQSEALRAAGDKRLFAHIRAFGPRFQPIPGVDIESLLHEAREARNVIAHQIAAGAIDMLSHEDGRRWLREHLERQVRAVAIGDRIISVALTTLTNDLMPAPSFVKDYDRAVTSWVFNT